MDSSIDLLVWEERKNLLPCQGSKHTTLGFPNHNVATVRTDGLAFGIHNSTVNFYK